MKTIEEYNREVREYYKNKHINKYKTNVECPNCKSEMYYSDDSILYSYPAQREVKCKNCGHKENIFVIA